MKFEAFKAKLTDPKVEQITIVALGDSNTELTWHTRGHLNCFGLLQEALFEKYGRGRCFVINAGRCGDSAQGALARLDRDVFRFEPDLVIVGFGMNDAGGGPEGLPKFREAVQAILRRCDEHGAAVLLRTPNPVLCSPGTASKFGVRPGEEVPGRFQGLYAQALFEMGNENHCPVVDHYTLWLKARFEPWPENPNTRWLRMSDEVHPGRQGHLAFYRELAPHFGLPTRLPWEE